MLFMVFFGSCTDQQREKSSEENKIIGNPRYEKGEYGYDLEFLKKKLDVVELVVGDSRLALVPEYQGRVMSTTSSGMKGYSHGWINYESKSLKDTLQNNNVFGGEERIWLGPEAGRFSVFYKYDDPNLEHWIIPDPLNTYEFKVVYSDSSTVVVEKDIELDNHSETTFHAKIKRTVTLLDKNSIDNLLDIRFHKSIRVIAYRSENILINTGNLNWDKTNGALSIWMLSMLKASPHTTVILPYNNRGNGKIVSTYFGEIPEERLEISNDALFFLADGGFRSKIGISPDRARAFMGSYDSKNSALTIIKFTIPEKESNYVNSRFDFLEDPFLGDVVNSYNSGPNKDSLQFYELESSSPAAFLKPGEQITHTQWIYHFIGNEKHLDKLTTSMLEVTMKEITGAFKNE